MAVPTTLADCSTNPNTASPLGTDSISNTTGPDDYLRAHESLIAALRDRKISDFTACTAGELAAKIQDASANAEVTGTGDFVLADGATLTNATLSLANGAVVSGTYVPSVSYVAGQFTADTPLEAQYMRVGNVVTVSGRIVLTAGDTNAKTLRLQIPVASAFAETHQAAGIISSAGIVTTSVNGMILAYSSGYVQASLNIGNTNSNEYAYHYTYVVV